ncbi:radical SAM protein [Actinomadura graeca]|uniref:Radical SAM protein n=1 Tax=Actinomadura graeca TaxID=2750812 RepID=A0ABX8R1F7_9ACTN|nr:radical SAM/SPASM domain-containing protein [Actinomadura graeca]QXJ22838.1 radical SAM protein [Actinomadura graeca]
MITLTKIVERSITRFLWLDLTRKCQLQCTHCYNASSPDGTHGTMTRDDWISVLDQAARCGVSDVQFIGGEPTLHPHALDLVKYALSLGVRVEVFTNLVRVPQLWWDMFQHDGVSLRTSYYSDHLAEHNAVTGRPSHRRTRENIMKAVAMGIPLRVGIIATGGTQRVNAALRDLEALGVRDVRIDDIRPFGRAAAGHEPDPTHLCGGCGVGRAAVGPDGTVSPCAMSEWMGVGNVQTESLADILGGVALSRAKATIQEMTDGPDDDDECSPGFPGSGCSPRN